MGRRRKGEPPAYKLHRASGQAYAELNGKQHYFGRHGSRESRAAYREFVAKWERESAAVIVARARDLGGLGEYVDGYLAELVGIIGDTERGDVRRNLETLKAKFGSLDADHFRAAELKVLRQIWIDAGHQRHTINKAVGRVRRFFRWMVANEFCTGGTLAVLSAVPDIAVGQMPEPDAVEPVAVADVMATLPFLREPGRTVIQVMLYAGPRPREACHMTGEEIHRSGSVQLGRRAFGVPDGLWVFTPTRFKQRKAGKVVAHVLGPKCQAVLLPWLTTTGPLFKGLHGAQYSQWQLWKDVKRAAKAAGVAHWHPHQVRHTFVTSMDAASDIVTASSAVGHAGIDTTLTYLQSKIMSVAEVARRIG